MKYYDENRNGYYNPDDGQDSLVPGENANWKAIQAGFAASAAKDSQQDTDVATAASTAEAARRTADQALEAAQALSSRVTAVEQDIAYLENPYDVRLVKLSINATYPVTIPANGFAVWSLVSAGSLIIPGTGPDNPDRSLEDFAKYAVFMGNRQFTFTEAGAFTNDLVAVYLRSVQSDGSRYSMTVTVNDSDITNGVIEVGIFNNSTANVILPAGSGIIADVFIRRAGEVWT